MMLWFFGLFAFSTLISQSAMDLFATLLCLTVVYDVFRRWQSGEPLRRLMRPVGFEWLWIVWLGWIGISFAMSPLKNTDWAARLLEFRWIFIFYCTSWAIINLRLSPRIQIVASYALGFCSLYAIGVWFLGFDPINPSYNLAPWSGGHRTGGFLSNAMTFGHLYGTYFCLFVGPTLMALKWRSRYAPFLLAALVLTGVAVLLSFTRGMWLAMAGATLVMAFVFSLRVGALLTMAGAAVLWVLTQVWPTLGERITMAFSSGDERQWIWKGHLQIFLDHPVFGVGYGENSRLIRDYYEKIGAPAGTLESHAHNQYLHFLAGTGVVGLLLYVAVLLAFLFLTIRTYRAISDREPFAKGLVLGCLGAQISFILGGLTEANFEHSKMKFVLLLVLSFVVWQAYEANVLKEKT